MGTPTSSWTRWSPWALRVAWIATGVVGSTTLDAAVDGRSDAVSTTATIAAGIGWLAGVIAMAVPATTSLTATRTLTPVAVVVAGATAVGGAPAVDVAALAVAAILSTLIAHSSEVGHAFVQASAYGDEQRFPLRPPVGYGLAAIVAWMIWTATIITGPLLVAAGSWLAGTLVCLLGVASTIFAIPRWHRLSRRWLVLVPMGLVLHDPVVLGETFMLPRSKVAGIRLAPLDTEALDLTGPASGHALEVQLSETATVQLAPTRTERRGRAIHLTAYLAAPSRPGRVLLAARDRRIPVG